MPDDLQPYRTWLQEHAAKYPLPTGFNLGISPDSRDLDAVQAQWLDTLARMLREFDSEIPKFCEAQ